MVSSSKYSGNLSKFIHVLADGSLSSGPALCTQNGGWSSWRTTKKEFKSFIYRSWNLEVISSRSGSSLAPFPLPSATRNVAVFLGKKNCRTKRQTLGAWKKTKENDFTLENRTQASEVEGERSNTTPSLFPSIRKIKERQGWNQVLNLVEDVPRLCQVCQCREQVIWLTLKPRRGGREQLVTNFNSWRFCVSVNWLTTRQNESIQGWSSVKPPETYKNC